MVQTTPRGKSHLAKCGTMDTVPTAVRSRNMSRIRSKNTAPELIVRSAAHAIGLRFRLHVTSLPGSPDLVFPRHRAVVLVHGCFWHRHQCPAAANPKSNVEYWTAKFARNVERDRKVRAILQASGWRCLVIWECETADLNKLERRIARFFGLPRP